MQFLRPLFCPSDAVYDTGLADLPDLRLPQVAAGTQPVWHLYVVRHPKRAALQAALADLGVPTALHYLVPNHSGAFKAEYGHTCRLRLSPKTSVPLASACRSGSICRWPTRKRLPPVWRRPCAVSEGKCRCRMQP